MSEETTSDEAETPDAYLQRLEKLEREVALLESQLPSNSKLISDSSKRSQNDENESALKNDVERMKYELQELTKHTGVEMTDCLSSLTYVGSDYVERGYTICVTCYQHSATLNIVVRETQVSKDESQSVVTQMEIMVDSDHLPEHIISAIESLQSSCDVMGFFHLWEAYCRTTSERKEVFSEISEKYPAVKLPDGADGATLMMKNKSSPSIAYLFHWEGLVTNNSKITPLIQMFVQAPKAVLDSEEGELLHNAPSVFAAMVKLHTPHHAMDTFIDKVGC